ncbi:MTH1187 family thiamine-binding protein [bacterium]|nr:MTH1187 family thiamine-binding protein [bacterium]
MALLAISVAPGGTGGTSVSDYVAKAIQVARDDGRVNVELGPMFSTLEGSFEDVWDVARKMHQSLVDQGAPRIATVIKIDDRRDKESTMASKLDAVNRKL